jgi:hypothetical protein
MKAHHIFPFCLWLSFAACGGEATPETESSAPAAPVEVRFTASDFTFDGPTSIEAGMVTFVFENNGPNLHHLQLVRLPEGTSLEAFQQQLSTLQPGTPPPAWMIDAGGVNPPAPGQAARATMMVEAGEYAVLCMVDTPDHVPHVFKGMIKPLTVTPSTTPAAAMPPSDMMLTLVDYAFSLSAPPTAGPHTIHVMNGATQSHEVVFIKLHAGKTMDDVLAWGATYEGVPPFDTHGGVSAIRNGQMANVYVDFTPGEWAALCFVPDMTDGMPHVAKGMVLPFTIS